MGNSQSIRKINYQDIQFILKNSNNFLLINTLQKEEQNCLIINTINIDKEETIINNLIQSMNKNINIIIYGRNCNDEKIYLKHKQLLSLGFYNVYVYVGGLFEWLLLQDIYGDTEFPTTEKELDILKYKANQILNIPLIEY
jgi:rhodanese-related sulfurtransferase